MLSRQEFINIIKNNESVIWNGSLVTSYDQIPSEAELALSSEDREAVLEAKINLEKEVLRLQAELAKVNAAQKSSDKEDKKKTSKDVGDGVKGSEGAVA